MRRLWAWIKLLVGLAVLLVVVAAGWVWFGFYDVSARAEHHPATQWLVETVRNRSVERRARDVDVRLPEPMDPPLLYEAAVAYEQMCAVCHAPPGRSRSALARGINPPAPDLTRAAQRRSPAQLFWVTKHGIRMSGMPAWGRTHDDADLWQLVALIRRFPDMSGDDYQALLAAARDAGVEHDHNDAHDAQGRAQPAGPDAAVDAEQEADDGAGDEGVETEAPPAPEAGDDA